MPSIRGPDVASDVVAAVKYLFSNRLYTDFYFISRDGKEKYHVHKLIIAIQSPVLAKSLYGDNPIKFLHVHYDSLPLQNLIRFLYEDDLLLENILDIKQTKSIADKYEIRQLGEICKYELNNVPVSISDVLSVLELSKEYQNEKKENQCLELISENQEGVFTSRQFLGLSFQKVLDIFEKLKKMKLITEASFLRLSIRWIDTNGAMNKKDLLMEKVDVTSLSLDEYLDIIQEFPVFFSGIEMSYALKDIRSRYKIQTEPHTREIETVKKESCDAETNTETNMAVETDSTTKEKNDCNTEMPLPNINFYNNEKHLSIEILRTKYDIYGMHLQKKARITIKEGNISRSVVVVVNDVLKKGLIGTVAEKENYSDCNVILSYEGLYFLIRSLKQVDETLYPSQYCEVLKAAFYFELKDVAKQYIKKIIGIIDYDPIFLDGLRTLSHLTGKCITLKESLEFKDKYTTLLLSEPLRVIFHPNFTKCSFDLISLLLQQSQLKIKDELQLLLVVISWLEAEKESRRSLRTTLLKNLAFQNISIASFIYAVKRYPNFFDKKVVKFILTCRNVVGSEVEFFRENLPEWYTNKTRKYF